MSSTLNRRQFLLAFGSGVAALGLAACGGQSSSAASSSSSSAEAASTPAAAESSASGTDFIVGFDQDYPPYGYVGDDGQFTGFDLELAQAVCKANGWNYKPQPINWDAKDAELNGGAITCIWNGFTLEGRENDYTFSEPYMLNAQVVVVRANSGITTLAGLAGKTVATQMDSAAEEVLKGDQASLAATFGTLSLRAEYNTTFMELESGAIDAVACDLSIAAYQMAAKPDAYVMLDERLSSEHYAVGFKKGEQAKADLVTSTLKSLDADGTVKKLCEKYADQGISYDNWCLGK